MNRSDLKIVRSRGPSRRLFLGAALQGLGSMMVGCGRDQGPRDFLTQRRPGPGTGSSSGAGGASTGGRAGTGGAPGSGGRLVGGEGGEGGALDPVGGAGGAPEPAPFPNFGPLGPANELGVRAPLGYSVRLLATSGMPVAVDSGYVWPAYPDGAACFELSDGGFIYVCNTEVNGGAGGVSSLVFSRNGELVDAYAIARGTSMNCQGGATPWGTFLTCEEVTYGRVLECDPLGLLPPRERLALGVFRHEGLAYDVDEHILYMTEDIGDGGFYRFLPERGAGGMVDLSAGTLEIARLTADFRIEWRQVPDPAVLIGVETRYQVEGAARFNGGEGIWYQEGVVYITTKGDDRVWAYDTQTDALTIVYDRATAEAPILSGVDCILGTAGGELLVAEDQGDMQIVVILPSGELRPLIQVENQGSSEVTGLALSPDGTRLFFSSQRGGAAGQGLTYEVTGPFRSS
jgi:hypothetical protein